MEKKKTCKKKTTTKKVTSKSVSSKNSTKKKKQNKIGFTLVELLAVIVILAVVMLIAVTSVGPMMEKSRKSSLGDEGVSVMKAAETAYTSAGLSNSSGQTSSVCYSLKYLCQNNFFEKGCDDDYTGSVLVVRNNGSYSYTFWLSNGTYAFNAANKTNFGDIDNVSIVYDGETASTDCGMTIPNGAPEEAKTASSQIINNLGGGTIKVCDTTCETKTYTESGSEEPSTPPIETISFTINGTTYTTKAGNTFGDWIMEATDWNTSGNHIVYVRYNDSSREYMLYKDSPGAVPGSDKILCEGSTANCHLTVGSQITPNGVYGDYYYMLYNYCCFDPEMRVLMADGTYKAIIDVKAGDMVMSLNEDTGEYIAQKVTDTIIKHNSDDLVYVHLSDGTKIGMRAYHPLLTTDGYKSLRPELAETTMEAGKKVEQLKVGDTVVGINGNAKVVKVETRTPIDNYDTYNLSIEGYHNYIVEGYVVHNAC